VTRGDALRFASRLPLAVIFRAVGAVAPWFSHSALLASGCHIPRPLALWCRDSHIPHYCPWLSYFAPAACAPWLLHSALRPLGYHISRRRRCCAV